MASFLRAHPDRAAAWSQAAGIDQGDIPDFLDELSPLILRADSVVTNHGFEDGELTGYPAVLQAGTAVLVDGYGTPRVKCYCGNPLSIAPRHTPARFEGQAWRHFDEVHVIVVRPAPVIVTNFTVINITNNVVDSFSPAPWSYGPPRPSPIDDEFEEPGDEPADGSGRDPGEGQDPGRDPGQGQDPGPEPGRDSIDPRIGIPSDPGAGPQYGPVPGGPDLGPGNGSVGPTTTTTRTTTPTTTTPTTPPRTTTTTTTPTAAG